MEDLRFVQMVSKYGNVDGNTDDNMDYNTDEYTPNMDGNTTIWMAIQTSI